MNVPAPPRPRIVFLAWLVPVLLLVAQAPASLSLGLDSDPIQWDLFTRSVFRGGVPYRDVCENNFPGMYWLQGTARALVGWSMGALRAVDLMVMTAVVALLVAWLPGLSIVGRALTAALLLACYLSTSEWCHCQRDPWMMFPALVALYLRRAQVRRLDSGEARAGLLFKPSLVEGLLWGLAVWVKPYAVVPAAAVWFRSVSLALRRGRVGWRPATADALGLLVGGLAAGGAGLAWLTATGAWPWFHEMEFAWNRDYLAVDVNEGMPLRLVYLGLAVRTFPWILSYLAAVPYAFVLLARVRPDPAARTRALLAAFYLGWLAQALFLQHCYDYVHVPTMLLSLTLLADLAARGRPRERWAVTALLSVFVAIGAGPRAVQRVALWDRCVTEGGTPDLRDRLGILHRTSWVELERVAVFLEGEGVRDREVTCLDMPSLPLYARLDLEAPTRYTLLRNCLTCFFRHRRPILDAVADSQTRLLVCDFTNLPGHPDLPPDAGAPGLPPLPERWSKPYPWTRHIVFRSGRFLVLRLDGPETRRWLTEVLGFTNP